VLDLLLDEKWGKDAAKSFQTITSDDDLLNKSNHAVIRLLHKQRFFNFVFPKLVQNAKAVEDEGPTRSLWWLTAALRSNYLIALSHIIANIPKELLLPELPSLLPLLLQSLSLPSPTLRANAINTLYVMVMESPEIMSENLETLIPVLLTQIPLSAANPPSVRIASLRCLTILPSQLSLTAIEPFKGTVIRAVGRVLDDPKRGVRKEAVDCRHAWYTSSGKIS
jgi:DNA repair/transcription protein MET18/MMS19